MTEQLTENHVRQQLDGIPHSFAVGTVYSGEVVAIYADAELTS